MAHDTRAVPHISVVVPVRNEEGNIAPLVAEIELALESDVPFEIIYVNDGSTDGTPRVLLKLMEDHPHLRSIDHAESCGQSAAVRTGVRAARAPICVTLDGDGQNDPAFIPQMVRVLEEAGPGCGLVQGQRTDRQAGGFKRLQSRVANAVRRRILKDGTRDTGCGLKCFRREAYLALPYFDALHRFMPALMKREGFSLAYVDVQDRPRISGVSNYGFLDRLWVGIVDLAGVRWLIKRRRVIPQEKELGKKTE
ncbi:MAG: glycosyltransferase family 2 protein [Verrucomicrobiales bacterium]